LSFQNVHTSALPEREIRQETLIPNRRLKCRPSCEMQTKQKLKAAIFVQEEKGLPFGTFSKALTSPKEQLKWGEKKMVLLM